MKIDSDGCGYMHKQRGKQKQGEKTHKWVSRTSFLMHEHGQKKQEVGNDDYGERRGHLGEIEGNQGVRGPGRMSRSNKQVQKVTKDPKKR